MGMKKSFPKLIHTAPDSFSIALIATTTDRIARIVGPFDSRKVAEEEMRRLIDGGVAPLSMRAEIHVSNRPGAIDFLDNEAVEAIERANDPTTLAEASGEGQASREHPSDGGPVEGSKEQVAPGGIIGSRHDGSVSVFLF